MNNNSLLLIVFGAFCALVIGAQAQQPSQSPEFNPGLAITEAVGRWGPTAFVSETVETHFRVGYMTADGFKDDWDSIYGYTAAFRQVPVPMWYPSGETILVQPFAVGTSGLNLGTIETPFGQVPSYGGQAQQAVRDYEREMCNSVGVVVCAGLRQKYNLAPVR